MNVILNIICDYDFDIMTVRELISNVNKQIKTNAKSDKG